MRKRKRKNLSKIKVLFVAIILFMLSGAGAMAVTTKTNSVTIKLQDGYEMTVLTNKTKVSEILKENNILVRNSEKVIPNIDEYLTENGVITILNKSEQEIQIAKLSESDENISIDTLLQAYDSIIEKIEIVKEDIPFETIQKDISAGSKKTENKVIQEGVKGLKEITYKVKYQNNTEISRIKISEKVVKKPVNKIVQINARIISSRSSNVVRTSNSNSASANIKIYKVTAYCACSKCCGKYSSGYTASGTKATAGRTVAASSALAFGTKLSINGQTYVVEDRGGAIQGNRIDVYMDSHSAALAWGVKYLPVEVIK